MASSVKFGELVVLDLYGPDLNDFSNDSIDIEKNKQITIGRFENNTFVIANETISGHHCIIWSIQFDEDSVPLIYLKDLSLNGTYVNNVKLNRNQTHLLENNDIIFITYGAVFKYISAFGDHDSSIGGELIKENNICTKFDDWSIKERVLGYGTFGYVLIAEKKNEKTLYAVKVVKNSNFEQVPFEAKILLKLDHPNIIKVYEAFSRNSQLYIFESLVCGGDLFSYLTKGSCLSSIPEFEALVITYQILSALKYLHKNNVVHRDLKLDNILLETPQPFTRIILADFGIAKSVSSTKRRMFTIVGTPEYCAPEVGFEFSKIPADLRSNIVPTLEATERFHKGYSFKCDVWSLGIIVHIMLSGISPFYEDGNEIHIIKSAKKGKLNFQLRQWCSTSEAAKDFVQSLLYVEMNQRYSIDDCYSHQWIKKHNFDLMSIYDKILQDSCGK